VTDGLTDEQTRYLLDSVPVGIIVTDGQKLVWLNEQAEKLTGLNADGLIGQPLGLLPGWLTTIFNEGGDQDRLTGEAGCEVLATVKSSAANPLLQACFLRDASQISQLQKKAAELEERVEALDTRDHVSGLLNQRGLLQALEAQVTRSRRYGNPLSIISLIIENYGVEADRKADVLAAMGYLFNDRLRWADSVGHIDEDEFILVLPETDAAAAVHLGEKLSNEFKALTLPNDNVSIALTITQGKATWRDGDDPARLLQRCRAQQD